MLMGAAEIHHFWKPGPVPVTSECAQ